MEVIQKLKAPTDVCQLRHDKDNFTVPKNVAVTEEEIPNTVTYDEDKDSEEGKLR